MERVEADARQREISKLTLSTLEAADHLWRFYERLGYVIVRRAPPGHGLDDNMRVFMEKVLD
jgi:ribosomal protein S18 acetylase RimI-like enzyme